MTRIELKARVGPDGVLALKVPVGAAEADHEVMVIVQPVEAGASTEAARATPDREAWRRFVDETAGAWQGEPLERPDQGAYERREDWG
jgi:hypothetical protein